MSCVELCLTYSCKKIYPESTARKACHGRVSVNWHASSLYLSSFDIKLIGSQFSRVPYGDFYIFDVLSMYLEPLLFHKLVSTGGLRRLADIFCYMTQTTLVLTQLYVYMPGCSTFMVDKEPG